MLRPFGVITKDDRFKCQVIILSYHTDYQNHELYRSGTKMPNLRLFMTFLLVGLAWPARGASIHKATTSSPGANGSACRLAANNKADLSLGFGYKLNCAPSTGTLNAFMFFIDFPDQMAAANDTPGSLYEFLVPEATRWYTTSSYGKLFLNVTADTTRFYRMLAPADSYGWQRELTSKAHEVYIQDALEAYSRVSNKSIPAMDVLYIVPTRAATTISFSPTYMGDVRTRRGIYVAKKAVTLGYDAYSAWKYKVINHETGHTMCLPDLYPLPSGATGLYVGGWDMMGYINGPSPDYFAWNKWKLGWLSDSQIDCVDTAGITTHTISPIEVQGNPEDIKAVVVKHNGTAALVAEVRSKLGGDEAACATGVLLYTVSTVTSSGDGPIRVLDANPGSRGCARDELNDAPLSLTGTRSYTVPGWGVKVSILDQATSSYTIRVEVS
jgi:M6 family metalloprotease-like protein